MRIAYDGTIFLRQPYGGISRYFLNLIEHISLSAEVNVVAPFHQNQYLNDFKITNSKNTYLGPISTISSKILQPYNHALINREVLELKPHIIHESYYNFFRAGPKSTKIVITIHDMIAEKFHSFLPFYDFSRYLKKLSIFRADHIICVSESTKKDLLNVYDLDEKRISVVYHGVSTPKFRDSSFNINKSHFPFLLYVGQRWRHKNFDFLIKSFSQSSYLKNNFSLIIFGGPKFSSNELSIFERFSILNKVTHINGDDIALDFLYRNASALVFPSLAEGFGLPIVEAMARGCPVIASNISSSNEIGSDGAIYFDPNSIEDFIFKAESLLSSKSKVKNLVLNGSEISKKFSWENCARKTLEIYKKLL